MSSLCADCKVKDDLNDKLREENRRLADSVLRFAKMLSVCRDERDDALATRIPPDSGALLKLGERLTHLLDEDAWNEIEPLLLAANNHVKKMSPSHANLDEKESELHNAPTHQKEKGVTP